MFDWQPNQEKGLIELWKSSAIGLCNIAPPVNQEPSIEYSLSGAEGPALSARYPVSAMQ